MHRATVLIPRIERGQVHTSRLRGRPDSLLNSLPAAVVASTRRMAQSRMATLAWREGFSMEGARALGKVCVVNLVHLLDSRHVCERARFASAGWLLDFPRLQVGGAATRVRVSQAGRQVGDVYRAC